MSTIAVASLVGIRESCLSYIESSLKFFHSTSALANSSDLQGDNDCFSSYVTLHSIPYRLFECTEELTVTPHLQKLIAPLSGCRSVIHVVLCFNGEVLTYACWPPLHPRVIQCRPIHQSGLWRVVK